MYKIVNYNGQYMNLANKIINRNSAEKKVRFSETGRHVHTLTQSYMIGTLSIALPPRDHNSESRRCFK